MLLDVLDAGALGRVGDQDARQQVLAVRADRDAAREAEVHRQDALQHLAGGARAVGALVLHASMMPGQLLAQRDQTAHKHGKLKTRQRHCLRRKRAPLWLAAEERPSRARGQGQAACSHGARLLKALRVARIRWSLEGVFCARAHIAGMSGARAAPRLRQRQVMGTASTRAGGEARPACGGLRAHRRTG